MRSVVTSIVTIGTVLFTGLVWADDIQPPLPAMAGVTAESDARFDATAGSYTYLYTAHDGAASKGNVGSVFLDDTAATDTEVPPGWIVDPRRDGSLMLSYAGTGPEKPVGAILVPGGEIQFSITSPGQPIITTLRLRADWIPEGEGNEDEATRAIYARLDTKTRVLGPGRETVGSFDHWSRFRDDIQLATSFDWMPDAQFAATVSAQLAAARRVFSTQGMHAAVEPLQTLLSTVKASTAAQRSAAALALLQLNTQALLAFASAAPAVAPPKPGAEFQLKLNTPATQTVAPGVPALFMGRLTDRADDDKPVANHPISVYVGYGPDIHTTVKGLTNADGRFSLELVGKAQGEDTVIVGDAPATATIRVVWKGGPDLVMDGFVPPMLHWRGFGPIYMNDEVTNSGNGPAGPSTVRYYASPTQPVDPKTARVVWTRQVPPLQPDETSRAPKPPVTYPADLSPGIYYITACVTEDSGPPETDLENNCAGSGEEHGMQMMMAAPAETTRP